MTKTEPLREQSCEVEPCTPYKCHTRVGPQEVVNGLKQKSGNHRQSDKSTANWEKVPYE